MTLPLVRSERRLISFDETPLFYRRWTIPGGGKGIVLIVHGMGEHGGRYEVFARFLAEEGLESLAPDLRGFGRSGGVRAYARNFSDYHRDLHVFHSFLERDEKGVPVFVLGHSFGGLVASSYLAFFNHRKTAGLVLTSPNFGIALPVPLWRHFLGIMGSYLAPAYSQENGVRPEMLTHDRKGIAQYLADPLIYRKISARLYRELVRMMAKRREIAERIHTPVLIVQAGEDHVVLKEETVRFYNRLAAGDKRLEIRPGMYHEVLNEIGSEDIFLTVRKWILDHISVTH